jgi:hypothetical protein
MSVTRQGYKTAQDVYLLGGSANTIITGSDVMQPVDIQSHYQVTVANHAAVLVAPNAANSFATFTDTNGFDRLSFTQKSNVSLNGRVQIVWSNDGVSLDSYENVQTNVAQYRSGEVGTKARYAKLHFDNLDATTAQTISTTMYLKA